jgi:hypothetical protein
MQVWEGWWDAPLLALSPVFIVVLKEERSILVYICKKEIGESI